MERGGGCLVGAHACTRTSIHTRAAALQRACVSMLSPPEQLHHQQTGSPKMLRKHVTQHWKYLEPLPWQQKTDYSHLRRGLKTQNQREGSEPGADLQARHTGRELRLLDGMDGVFTEQHGAH